MADQDFRKLYPEQFEDAPLAAAGAYMGNHAATNGSYDKGQFVVKAARDRDLYLIWSTVVDAPLWVGDKNSLTEHVWDEYRREHPRSTPNRGHSPDDRIRRADEAGTSALDCDWYGWDDDTFMVGAGSPDDGWYHIRRDRLADYAERLLADDEAGAQALLECFKRHGDPDD